MLKGITILFLFLFLGEVVVKVLMIPFPSPIIGMILLLIYLLKEKKYSNNLNLTVEFFLKYLPIFILPSALGLMTQIKLIQNELFSITISLIVSTILSIIISAKTMDYFMKEND